MSLSEFLLRWNERPVLSGFVRRSIPARTARYSWGRVLVVTAIVAGLFAVLLGTPFVILGEPLMASWIALTAAEFGACVGLSVSLLSRLCWNQRAARLAAAPDSPEVTAPWPQRGFFLRFCFSLFYTVIVGLVTPLLLFHAIENMRGAWAWRQLRAELKAKGECYELSCVIPPPARDEDNFFSTPFWQQFVYRQEILPNGNPTNIWLHGPGFAYATNFTLPEAPETTKRVAGFSKEPTDGRVDLAAWAAHLRFVTTNTGKGKAPNWTQPTFPLPATPGRPADDVLFSLSKFDATLAEFAAAASRPRNRYPIHYEEGFLAALPNLAAMKAGARICQLRAVARLAAGDSDGAAADTLLGYRLGESMNEEPVLISQLVRFAMDAIAHHALWEGLAAHRWNDAQLVAFQQRLSQLDYGAAILHAFEGERALGNDAMESMVNHRLRALTQLDRVGNYPDNGSITFEALMPVLMPSGWFRQNQIGLLRGYQMTLDHARMVMNPANRKERLATQNRQNDPADDYLQQIAVNRSPFNLIVRMLLPAIGKATDKADRAQTIAQMAIIACALERHRLAHGTFPATLGELAPAYLTKVPTDWMSGEPFHYQRTEDGWFRLWSVGPDGKDDGGIYREDTKARRMQDLDWPWPSPVPSREPRLF